MRVPTRGSLIDRFRMSVARTRHLNEADQAAAYWASLSDFRSYDQRDPSSWARSLQVAEIVTSRGLGSMLEVGCNSGRNLAALHERVPGIRLMGIDVNASALEHARATKPGIEFRHEDARAWSQPERSWDGILTMSVLDHIPDDAAETVAANMARTVSNCVISVELWDGSEGVRGSFKYGRDTRALFERHGLETVTWEKSAGQYDDVLSQLYIYVGAVPAALG